MPASAAALVFMNDRREVDLEVFIAEDCFGLKAITQSKVDAMNKQGKTATFLRYALVKWCSTHQWLGL